MKNINDIMIKILNIVYLHIYLNIYKNIIKPKFQIPTKIIPLMWY